MNGCDAILSLTEKIKHERACTYNFFPCPIKGDCCRGWKSNDINQVIVHMTSQHKNIPLFTSANVCISLNGIEQSFIKLTLSCFDSIFVVSIKNVEGFFATFCVFAQVLGSEEDAAEFGIAVSSYEEDRDIHRKLKVHTINEEFPDYLENNHYLLHCYGWSKILFKMNIFKKEKKNEHCKK